MENGEGPIEFLRKKMGSGYIKVEFISFKKTREGREKYSSPVSYEIEENFLNIFFLKSGNPRKDFKKHREYMKKEKESMILVITLNWKGDPEMRILYACEIISTEDEKNSFKIRILGTTTPKPC